MLREEVYEFIKGPHNLHLSIGFGSFGEVKLARSTTTHETVAIKLIYGKNAHQQIALHKRLVHPNIIRLINYTFDEAKKTTYLVLEYAEGGTLYNKIRTSTLKREEIKKIFQGVCEGIKAMHNVGVMHRDLKPENILLSKQGSAKLCDFGFASSLGDRKTMCGTYQYMAPQMIQQQPYDQKIDIWALGILLFEMIQGNAPFRGQNANEVLMEMKKSFLFSNRFDENQINLIKKILRVRPNHRPSIQQILAHPFLKESGQNKSNRTTVSTEGENKSPETKAPRMQYVISNTKVPSLTCSQMMKSGVQRSISQSGHLFAQKQRSSN